MALFPSRVVAFLRSAQPELWAEMAALHGSELEERIIAALVRELDTKGTLDVLRHGFKFYGKTHRLAWFKPAHGLNSEVDGTKIVITTLQKFPFVMRQLLRLAGADPDRALAESEHAQAAEWAAKLAAGKQAPLSLDDAKALLTQRMNRSRARRTAASSHRPLGPLAEIWNDDG